MKSKVILFCVLLFCSKIADSIPHSEDHDRQRVNPQPNWQVNQHAPNTQYFDTDFTETRNVNIQPGKTQDFYPNQGRRHNYDTNVYNRSPASSPSGEDLLVSYDSPAHGLRLDSYPSRVESYPSRTSQVGFDNQQYRNQNWRPQNQYTKPASSAVLLPDDKTPLVTTVQEPYRGPVQYLQPKYVPPTNRRFYQPGRTYLTRKQVQYPLTGERKYVANSAPRFGSSGPVPYENYVEDQVAASEIKARPTGGRRYAQSIVPQPGIIYNEAPAVTAADTLTGQSENIEFAENYRSRSVLSNSAQITNQDIRSPLISEPDNNSDSIPSLAHINTKKDAPVIISKILTEKPLARRYANNYISDSGWSNNVGDDSYNGAPVVNEAEEVAHHGSSSPTPTNTNPKLNLYPTISSEGITEYNLNSFVAQPEIQNILATTNKRYVVVHPNGTYEFLDRIDLGSPQNSKLRLVHHKRKNIEGSDSYRVLTQQLPENLPYNIAKNPLSVGKYLLPTNNQPADDKKLSPLKVDQAEPADEYDSNLSPSLKNLLANHSNLKPSRQPAKQPADNNNYKLLPSSSTSNEDQSIQNDNLKPLPQGVNQPRDDDDSKTLTPDVNQSSGDGNSKPLPQDRNKPADQKNQSPNDDYLKPLTSKENQAAVDLNSKIDQTSDENNFTPLFPNARQPANVKKPKNSYVKHPVNDNNSEPLRANENQPQDDKPFHTYRSHPAHHYISKLSHVNQPADNNNSNPSSSGESQPANDSNSWPSNEDQPGSDTDFTSLLPHKKHPSYHYKPKSRQPHDQPADDNPSTIPKLSTYPKNQLGGDKNSNPSSPNENAPESNENSKPLPSNEHQSGDETDSPLLLSHKKQPSHHFKPKSRYLDNQPADDNPSTTPQLSTYPKNQPGGDKNSKPSSPNENAPESNDNSKPLPSNEHQSGDETDSISLPSHKKQPSNQYKPKSRQSHDQPADDNPSTTPKLSIYPENQPGGDKNSNPSSPNENAPESNDNSKPLPSNEHQSGDETDSTSLPSQKKQPSNQYKPRSRQSHDQPADDNPSNTPKLSTYLENQPGGDKNSNLSSPNENARENNDNSKQLPSNEHQSGVETDSTSLPSQKKQPSNHYKPISRQSHDQPADDNNSNPSSTPLLNYPKNQPGDYDNSNPSSPSKDQTEDNNTSEPLNENQSRDGNDSESLRKNKRQPANDDEERPRDNNDSELLPAHATQSANNTKSKPSDGAQPGNDNNSNTSSSDENQSEEDKKSKPLHPNENQPTDDLKTKPISADASKTDDQSNSTTVSPTEPNHTTLSKPQAIKTHKRKHMHRTSTTSSPVTVVSTTPCPDDPSEDQIITLSPIEQTTDNVSDVLPVATTTTTTRPVKSPSKSDNDANNKQDNAQDDITQTYSTTTVSPSTSTSPTDNISDDKTKGTKENEITQTKDKIDVDQVNNREKDTQTVTVVSTTPCPDDPSEDQIITLSPIEQTTDNVSDVPPVATTTTTTRPVKSPGKSDNDANNKQDNAQDDITQTYFTTTVSPSTSTSPTDNISDDKTKGTKENEITQTKNKIDVDQVNNREKDTQTAVYNSTELFDTNTDVPAKSDDCSIVTASPSVQNDVDTGDASGDNSLELQQSETDVTITVSSSTANDSEDEMITINIEVSESTDDTDSSSNDKSLVVSIDKNDGSDDDSKTPTPEDCKKDHNNDGRGNNVEIDVSNLKGEPTMWIRTTNQDFVDKLTAKNDTEFDLIYFFHIDNQPAIEREKTTTIHCNGTVVTEITEITYANKDDLTPTIVKTTKIMDLEHYKADEV